MVVGIKMKSGHRLSLWRVVLDGVLALVVIGVCVQVISACDDMWYGFQGNCYRMFWRPVPIEGATVEARGLCRLEGADLVTIKSSTEADHVQSLFFKDGCPINQAFMGLSDAKDEGVFEWIDGTPLTDTGFTSWKTGEPNNYPLFGSENCGGIKILSTNITVWFDVPCLSNPRGIQGYICEKAAHSGSDDIISSKFHVVKDYVMIGQNTTDVAARDTFDCAMRCSRDVTCLSATFKRSDVSMDENICRMNNASRFEISEMFTSNMTILGFDPTGWKHLEPRLPAI